MTGFLTALGVGGAAVAVVLVGVLVARRRAKTSHSGVDREFLLKLGKGLGLDEYFDRELFGEHIQVLRGQFDELPVEMEISEGVWEPYVRITIEFPRRLAQDLQVLSDDKGSLISHIRRMRETELGHEDFDENFLLFARDEDRLGSVMSESTRFQLLRLVEDVDELRISDNTLFLLAEHGSTSDEVSTLLKKSLDLAERLYETARLLGPRRPESEAAHYEQATLEQITRQSQTEDGERSGERSRSGE